MPEISLRAQALLTANALRNLAHEERLIGHRAANVLREHADDLDRSALADVEREAAENPRTITEK